MVEGDGQHRVGLCSGFGEDLSPRVGAEGVSVVDDIAGRAGAVLGGGGDVALVFDGAGAQQRVPVGLAGGGGEGGGAEDDVAGGEGAVQLGEAEVEADAQREAPAVEFEGYGRGAGGEEGALVIHGVAAVHPEEVDLVVAGQAPSVGGDGEGGVEELPALGERHAAGHQGGPAGSGQRRQPFGPVGLRPRGGAHGGGGSAAERVLGQEGDVGRAGEVVEGLPEPCAVGLWIVARGGLDEGQAQAAGHAHTPRLAWGQMTLCSCTCMRSGNPLASTHSASSAGLQAP
ncbi:MAG: hypothetical protein BWZ02_03206 [Lentisphaerae bacterium ADurb.BinA184]|nr:MAG: hypothetical protein BWZ02_03206 [Lentisphaerae bacterium ADurb.BinA184]